MVKNALIFNPTIIEYFNSALSQNTSLLYVHFQFKDDDLKFANLNKVTNLFLIPSKFLGYSHFYCKFTWDEWSSNFYVYYKGKSPCRYYDLVVTNLDCTWLANDSTIFLAHTDSPRPGHFEFSYAWV